MSHSPSPAAALPGWLRQVALALPFASQFVISGSVADLHRVHDAVGAPLHLDAVAALVALLRGEGYELVYRYDPLDGIVLAHTGAGVDSDAFFPDAHLGRSTAATPGRLADLVKLSTTQTGLRVAVVVDVAETFWREDGSPAAEVRTLLQVSQRLTRAPAAGTTRPGRRVPLLNPVLWLVDGAPSAPAWLVRSPGTASVSIPLPELAERLQVARDVAPRLPDHDDLAPEQQEGVVAALAESTQGMTVRAMHDVARLAVDQDVPAERVSEAVRSFRAGSLESPWRDPALLERVARAEEIITRRVLGQQRAVRRSLDVLLRSATGLTGSQHRGSSSRPQGVLFFAGPTGVGKTELAKALAEVLFGADDACTRFDMSEFTAEHSEARLIGAPPGYVGFQAGGELTNAVRQKPFSILLFDEVEKAHPRILDKFLQILEDGRLTDGSGSTVYFSECVIIFTSNLGASQAAARSTAPGPVGPVEPEAARAAVLTAVERHFVEELQRPELLNRIGDNVVVFDAVSEQVARVLVERQAGAVLHAVLQRRGVHVVLEAPVLAALEEQAVANLGFGGRGVGAAVEAVLVNPLARTLVTAAPHDGTLRVTAVRRGPEGWELVTAT